MRSRGSDPLLGISNIGILAGREILKRSTPAGVPFFKREQQQERYRLSSGPSSAALCLIVVGIDRRHKQA